MPKNPGHLRASGSDPVLCLVELCFVKVKTFHNWLIPQSRLYEIIPDAILDSYFMKEATQMVSTEIIDFYHFS